MFSILWPVQQCFHSKSYYECPKQLMSDGQPNSSCKVEIKIETFYRALLYMEKCTSTCYQRFSSLPYNGCSPVFKRIRSLVELIFHQVKNLLTQRVSMILLSWKYFISLPSRNSCKEISEFYQGTYANQIHVLLALILAVLLWLDE